MTLNDYDENEPILIAEWETVPILKKMEWNSRNLAMMVRCKLVNGVFTSTRQCKISKAEMRKALQIVQRNTGLEEPIRFD